MPIPLSARFLSLIVHDLRNPLNAIDLSLQVIDQEVPPGCPDLEDDLRMVRENTAQIERMLKHLADYSRLLDEPVRLTPMPFDARRFLADLVEDHAARSPAGAAAPVTLEVRPGCPAEVDLDQARAQVAIRHVLANALAAAEGAVPVRLVLDGTPARLVLAAHVDRVPHASVKPAALRPDGFDRLMGSPAGRLSLELTIAARISELFGGSARLDVEPGRGTAVVLDWPARIAATAGLGDRDAE